MQDPNGREWFDKQRINYVHLWSWDRLTALMGAESMACVEPINVYKWAKERDIERYLPFEYGLASFDNTGSK